MNVVKSIYVQAIRMLCFDPGSSDNWPWLSPHPMSVASIFRVIQKQAGEKEAATVTVDGVVQPGNTIAFVDDGREHAVEVVV